MDQSRLIEELCSTDIRLLNVVGMMGVGKSALVKQVFHKVKDRKIFLGGMLLVQAKSLASVDGLLDELLHTMIKGIVCEETTKKFHDEATYGQKDVKLLCLKKLINSSTNKKQSDKIVKAEDRGFNSYEKCRFFICFDNC